ncbi:MAG TPA: hypothetical protein VEH27_10260 [Methylomirabilota bacterium]|nr:hypothetical protein [Methylomirabilota bacterium]
MRILSRAVCLACLVLLSTFVESQASSVTRPPDTFFDLVPAKHRESARKFYTKHLSVDGLPVAAAAEVDDKALHRTQEIVTNLLAGRRDILQAMVSNRMYLIIIGKDQVYTDMPEYSDHPNPAFQNERVRGTGGRPTSFGEENVLSLPLDRYDDESIGVHEFCHTIDSTLASIDKTWRTRLDEAYRKALAKGLWKNTYAAGNAAEFWAEAAQSYFDCNRVNNWNHGPIGTREQLKEYDPETYALVHETFNLKPHQDWRYSWLQKLPNVTTPPARLQIDAHYQKFTWAREFPVVSKSASEESLLSANDTIRKMFAYRHDILKALINDGAKLVVLGPEDRMADLPELKGETNVDLLARIKDYDSASKLLVVGEELLQVNGRSHVIGLFARASFQMTAHRSVDPNWERRGNAVQQYELRVERLDSRFGAKVEQLHAAATSGGKWKGCPGAASPNAYWTEGVLAYFDAAGQLATPVDATHPIATTEMLERYDANLLQLVKETMAYEGKPDWRFKD